MNEPSQSAAHEHNRRAWDRYVRTGGRFTRPASDADFANPLAAIDGRGWLGGDVAGKHVLCLAAGGGKQGPLYAAAGAVVTVVDISPAMLELDRQVARQRGLELRTVEASMDHLAMLGEASFDIVAQPVSTCYVPDVAAVYRQVARVTRPGGLYISQHKQPVSLQTEIEPREGGYLVREPYYRSGPLPNVEGSRLRESGALEFLHRWEQLLGELCRSGFVIEDLSEPMHGEASAPRGDFKHRGWYIAPYVRVKARRSGGAAEKPRLLLQ